MDDPSPFSSVELAHYSRHILLPELGIKGQTKLKKARVLVIGAGGLGCPILQYLVAAGVGSIGIVDGDIVDATNLHRQILYSIDDIGKSKVEAACATLAKLNPHIILTPFQTFLTPENAASIFRDYDVVIDGSDNFPTRYLVNDACVLFDKPNVYGSIFRFEGQVSVFNLRNNDGTYGPNYRDLFPSPPAPGMVPSCAEAGVLGVLPGIIGCFQAVEVIKIITGIGEVLNGKLLLFDAMSTSTRILNVPTANSRSQITTLIDYQEFCGMSSSNQFSDEIAPQSLHQMMENLEEFQLLDVRKPYEYDICNLGGLLIPLGTLREKVDEIEKDKPVIVYCRSGQRSRQAIDLLTKEFGFKNLINLTGGILAYADQVDSSLMKY